MNVKPSELYQQRLQRYALRHDPGQLAALYYFDQLHLSLMRTMPDKAAWWHRFLRLKRNPGPTGLYLWGGVGRGKTMLMDIFYEALPFECKSRLHFHHFINKIHQQLRSHKNRQNPLALVAKHLAQQTRVLCLDEFHVNDITDAMLLSGLLVALHECGVCLVTTSNQEPDNLYQNGLQRSRFLPAIEFIKTRMVVLNLDNEIDYRLETLRNQGTYHYPLSNENLNLMQTAFETLSSHEPWEEGFIVIGSRKIPVKRIADGVAWFDFDTLCNSPRSQADYIEIACRHHSLLLSGLPAMSDMENDAARRFLNLIDVFYDHRVNLIIAAAVPIEKIYTGRRLAFEFQRAISRLVEMQSENYLGRSHHT
ncbi:MAG TPA: cell division protein ZapE [Gammaproteobacteria bacterium]|jgi:cell division protein ZapE